MFHISQALVLELRAQPFLIGQGGVTAPHKNQAELTSARRLN